MFLWKNIENDPKIIPVTPPYLEHCTDQGYNIGEVSCQPAGRRLFGLLPAGWH